MVKSTISQLATILLTISISFKGYAGNQARENLDSFVTNKLKSLEGIDLNQAVKIKLQNSNLSKDKMEKLAKLDFQYKVSKSEKFHIIDIMLQGQYLAKFEIDFMTGALKFHNGISSKVTSYNLDNDNLRHQILSDFRKALVNHEKKTSRSRYDFLIPIDSAYAQDDFTTLVLVGISEVLETFIGAIIDIPSLIAQGIYRQSLYSLKFYEGLVLGGDFCCKLADKSSTLKVKSIDPCASDVMKFVTNQMKVINNQSINKKDILFYDDLTSKLLKDEPSALVEWWDKQVVNVSDSIIGTLIAKITDSLGPILSTCTDVKTTLNEEFVFQSLVRNWQKDAEFGRKVEGDWRGDIKIKVENNPVCVQRYKSIKPKIDHVLEMATKQIREARECRDEYKLAHQAFVNSIRDLSDNRHINGDEESKASYEQVYKKYSEKVNTIKEKYRSSVSQ